MISKDLITHTLMTSDFITNAYIGDLSAEEMLLCPVSGMNHIAWQFGHLISSEHAFAEAVKPDASPTLPAGFDGVHSTKSETKGTSPSQFYSKDEYLKLYKAQREATLKILSEISEEELSKPAPEAFLAYAPTAGAMLNMIGLHYLMHVGQFVAVRRATGKPVTI
jgi:hypothetical protein